jgi:transposase
VDCRKLARELSSGNLEGIYIPDQKQLHDRQLVRTRYRLVTDQTRLKNRIKSFLHFYGIAIGEQFEKSSNWSAKFIEWLLDISFEHQTAKTSLALMVEEYKQIRKLVIESTKAIRTLANTEAYAPSVKLLRSIPGIGLINAMVILTELGDIKRFKDLDHLCAYVGFTPEVKGTGDHEHVGGIDHRGNRHLREAIIESAWQIIRKDPAMLYCFKSYCRRMVPNKAIIKISRKLLNRIRYVLITGNQYQIRIMQKKTKGKFLEASTARIEVKKSRSTKTSTIQAG